VREEGGVEKNCCKNTRQQRGIFSQKIDAREAWQIHSGALSTMPLSGRQDSRGISRREAGKLRREKEKHFRQSLPSIDSSVSFARSITAETRCQLLAAAQDDAARRPRALTDVRKAWHVWRKWCVEKLLQKHTSTGRHFFQKINPRKP
jgi:hypothetical protein